MVFTIFGCLFVKLCEVKFLLASMKTLTNFKNLFKKVVPGFRALMALKLVPKADHDIYVHCFKLNGNQAENEKYSQKTGSFTSFKKVGKCTDF